MRAVVGSFWMLILAIILVAISAKVADTPLGDAGEAIAALVGILFAEIILWLDSARRKVRREQ